MSIQNFLNGSLSSSGYLNDSLLADHIVSSKQKNDYIVIKLNLNEESFNRIDQCASQVLYINGIKSFLTEKYFEQRNITIIISNDSASKNFLPINSNNKFIITLPNCKNKKSLNLYQEPQFKGSICGDRKKNFFWFQMVDDEKFHRVLKRYLKNFEEENPQKKFQVATNGIVVDLKLQMVSGGYEKETFVYLPKNFKEKSINDCFCNEREFNLSFLPSKLNKIMKFANLP